MTIEQRVEALPSSLRGRVLRTGDDEYETARHIWNGMVDRRPGMIVRAAGAADVLAAVNFAREQNLPLAIRGGGHSAAGSSVCDEGVMLDLSLM
jgi:FAD/FMN-containing dehydrogenase